MTSISTVIKNYIIVFKHEDRPNEYITHDQFLRLHGFLMDYKKPQFVDMTDDKGNYKETLKRGDFVLRQAETKNFDGNSRWICGFGTRHPMHEWPAISCGCKEKYTCDEMGVRTGAELKQWLAKFMNAEIRYDGDIDDNMRATFVAHKKQQTTN